MLTHFLLTGMSTTLLYMWSCNYICYEDKVVYVSQFCTLTLSKALWASHVFKFNLGLTITNNFEKVQFGHSNKVKCLMDIHGPLIW